LKKDLEILDLFMRYLDWIKINNFKDTINNYRVYFEEIEKVQFTYGDWYFFNYKTLYIDHIWKIKMTCSNCAGHFYFSNIQEIKSVRNLESRMIDITLI